MKKETFTIIAKSRYLRTFARHIVKKPTFFLLKKKCKYLAVACYQTFTIKIPLKIILNIFRLEVLKNLVQSKLTVKS